MDIDFYLSYLSVNNYSQKTITLQENSLKRFRSFIKSKDITKEIIQEYIYHTLQTKLKDGTKSVYLGHLKVYLNTLYDCEHIEEDFNHLFKDIIYSHPLPKRPLTTTEIDQIRSVIPTNTINGYRDRVIFETFYGTGIRRAELINLKVQDISLSKNEVFIHQGKGKKDRYAYLGNTLSQYLKDYFEEVRPRLYGANYTDKAFVSSNHPQALDYSSISTIFNKYCKTSEIPFSAHLLRHTFATQLLRNGVYILYIQELLGHERIKTTQKYTHIQPEELIKEVRRFHLRW